MKKIHNGLSGIGSNLKLFYIELRGAYSSLQLATSDEKIPIPHKHFICIPFYFYSCLLK
jgi:hypothetical protein